jgi:hypothetical protein
MKSTELILTYRLGSLDFWITYLIIQSPAPHIVKVLYNVRSTIGNTFLQAWYKTRDIKHDKGFTRVPKQAEMSIQAAG